MFLNYSSTTLVSNICKAIDNSLYSVNIVTRNVTHGARHIIITLNVMVDHRCRNIVYSMSKRV